MPDDKEVLIEDKTMIRHTGNVHVATIPASLLKNQTVKNNKGIKGPIRLVREKGTVYLQIPLKISLKGTILEVKREKE